MRRDGNDHGICGGRRAWQWILRPPRLRAPVTRCNGGCMRVPITVCACRHNHIGDEDIIAQPEFRGWEIEISLGGRVVARLILAPANRRPFRRLFAISRVADIGSIWRSSPDLTSRRFGGGANPSGFAPPEQVRVWVELRVEIRRIGWSRADARHGSHSRCTCPRHRYRGPHDSGWNNDGGSGLSDRNQGRLRGARQSRHCTR